MARGIHTEFHPNRQVGAERFTSGAHSSPTPDSGSSAGAPTPVSQALAPLYNPNASGSEQQQAWEGLTDAGMSPETAEDTMHTMPSYAWNPMMTGGQGGSLGESNRAAFIERHRYHR